MQNIDTDQIIPAEYLTLVPSKVRTSRSGRLSVIDSQNAGRLAFGQLLRSTCPPCACMMLCCITLVVIAQHLVSTRAQSLEPHKLPTRCGSCPPLEMSVARLSRPCVSTQSDAPGRVVFAAGSC